MVFWEQSVVAMVAGWETGGRLVATAALLAVWSPGAVARSGETVGHKLNGLRSQG